MPGVRMVYSDIGAIVLTQVVARVSGMSLDALLRERVFAPLAMAETMYRPSASLRPRIAPTEIDPWRGRQLQGEVHDENAFALGGVSGHAGLFSTAADLTRFAQMYVQGGVLDGHRIFSSDMLAMFTSVQDSAFSNRALGWETPTGNNSAGSLMRRPAFGHTGFTGTSLWIDPAHNLFVLVLTNRVNPTRAQNGIAGVRRAIADAAMSYVLRAP
jgi:CubicO group peptidase (beta-lactamase class C family)